MQTNWSMEARKLAYLLSVAFEDLPRGMFHGPLSKCIAALRERRV